MFSLSLAAVDEPKSRSSRENINHSEVKKGVEGPQDPRKGVREGSETRADVMLFVSLRLGGVRELTGSGKPDIIAAVVFPFKNAKAKRYI